MAGGAKSGSVTVVGTRAIERMNVPCARAVTVPVGEEARPGSRTVVTGGVPPVAVPAVRVVTVAEDAARVPMVPVGARLEPVRVEVERVGVPVMSVGVPVMSVDMPRVMRPGSGRGVSVGDREKGHERPEREPRGEVAIAVPVVMPPSRLGGTAKGDHDRDRQGEHGSAHHRILQGGTAFRRRAAGAPRCLRVFDTFAF